MADTSLDKLMKLSAALPSEDAENGLDHLAQQAYENPKGTIIIGIVVLDTLETKYRPATDQEVAVVRIREIEAVRLDAAPHLYEQLRDMRTSRRGTTQDELLGEDEPLEDHLPDEENPWPAEYADTVAVVPADEDGVIRLDRSRR